MRNIKLKPMAQQTAVEWLLQIQLSGNGRLHLTDEEFKQALQMEKEQMIELTQTLTSTPSDISRDTATFIVENFINR